MGYTKNAIKGISWMSGFRGLTRLLAFVKIAVLARVLSPAQFGVFGIASLVLTLLETLTETGINIVLIQSKNNFSEYINSAWVVSIIRGTLISLCIIILAPFIAAFFHSPEAVSLILFISLVPFVRGFINPAEVKFRKELNFNKEFWFRTVLFFTDALIAVFLALTTQSVYSLVWGLLAGALLEVIISFLFIKPRPRFVIHKTYFKRIISRGAWITGYTTLNYFAENGDNIIVGRILGAPALGLYQMAYKISILPITEISDVVSSVAFPVFAKISGEAQRLKMAFLKIILPVFFTSLFLGSIILLFPQQIILILLGDKWLSVTAVLQVLALYGVLRTLSGPISAVFLSLQKQKYVTTMIFFRFAVLAVVIYPFVSWYGLIGAGYAQLLSVIVELPVMLFLLAKAFKTSK